MAHSEGPADQNDDRSSVIVLAPEAWRQQIQVSMNHVKVQVRYFQQQQSGIASRSKQLQAEQAVTLAAEAAHRTDSTGAAMVLVDETVEKTVGPVPPASDLPTTGNQRADTTVSLTLAIHHIEQTELNLWTFESSHEAIEFLIATASQISSTESPISSARRRVASRRDLFAAPLLDQTTWSLTENQKFISSCATPGTGILSGSFNPLHSGHRKMRAAAAEILGTPVIYEMTLRNADKPPLDYLSLSARAGQFSPGELLLTAVPTFSEKAALLPQSTFVIGWDTAVRVLDHRFYEAGQFESAFENFAACECQFLVAARRERGRLHSLEDLTIPGKFRDLFATIPPELFEEDISSTAIRDAWLRGESNIGPPLCMLFETHTH